MPEDPEVFKQLQEQIDRLQEQLRVVSTKVSKDSSDVQSRLDFAEAQQLESLPIAFETGNESWMPKGEQVTWVYCEEATEEAKPPSEALPVEGESNTSMIPRLQECTIRALWDIQWNSARGTLEKSYAYYTFRGGILVKIDTGDRGSADSGCAEIVVEAVDCDGEGSYTGE